MSSPPLQQNYRSAQQYNAPTKIKISDSHTLPPSKDFPEIFNVKHVERGLNRDW